MSHVPRITPKGFKEYQKWLNFLKKSLDLYKIILN